LHALMVARKISIFDFLENWIIRSVHQQWLAENKFNGRVQYNINYLLRVSMISTNTCLLCKTWKCMLNYSTWTNKCFALNYKFYSIGEAETKKKHCVCMYVCIYIYIYISYHIIYLSWNWATCWPVLVSCIQKSLQRSAMIPSASWGIVLHYPG
jgi:hypothetical protein